MNLDSWDHSILQGTNNDDDEGQYFMSNTEEDVYALTEEVSKINLTAQEEENDDDDAMPELIPAQQAHDDALTAEWMAMMSRPSIYYQNDTTNFFKSRLTSGATTTIPWTSEEDFVIKKTFIEVAEKVGEDSKLNVEDTPNQVVERLMTVFNTSSLSAEDREGIEKMVAAESRELGVRPGDDFTLTMEEPEKGSHGCNHLAGTSNSLLDADPNVMSRFILLSVPKSKGTTTLCKET